MEPTRPTPPDANPAEGLGNDAPADVLADGVVAVLKLLSAPPGSPERPAAEAAWESFEESLSEADGVRLATARKRFRLDRFELRCLVLALARHVEPRMSAVVGRLSQKRLELGATVGLALEYFCATAAERVEKRRAFLPSGRMIRHSLVRLADAPGLAGGGLLAREVELSAPFSRFVLGEEGLSEGVAKVARLERPEVSILNVILPPEQVAVVREFVAHHARYRDLLADWGFHRIVPYGRGHTFLFAGPSGG
ncbi:MAG: hypothetical protein FJ087_22970, partial [Deltaproteobacteria bacterium]|nr:hypothetical protein [Deltaproteobacteria bacterium]